MTGTAASNKDLVITSEIDTPNRFLSGTHEFQHVLDLHGTTSMGYQSWYWNPEWQEREREATNKIQNGQRSVILQSFGNLSSPSLTDDVIHSLFQNLVEEAQEPGETMPPDEVIQESKRIVTNLLSELPTDSDIYTETDGKIAIEIFGKLGHAFLLVCEPGGSALCVVTVDCISRRARYDDSTRLPDEFVREGLRDVRPDADHFHSTPTFDW